MMTIPQQVLYCVEQHVVRIRHKHCWFDGWIVEVVLYNVAPSWQHASWCCYRACHTMVLLLPRCGAPYTCNNTIYTALGFVCLELSTLSVASASTLESSQCCILALTTSSWWWSSTTAMLQGLMTSLGRPTWMYMQPRSSNKAKRQKSSRY